MSLNLNAALSSFIADSPRIIHHSKTQHWKKKKNIKTFHWAVSRPKHYLCVNPVFLIVVVVARAGLFRVRQIREWATYVLYLFIYFYFAATSSPPFVTSAAPSSVLAMAPVCLQVLFSRCFLVSPFFSCLVDSTSGPVWWCLYLVFARCALSISTSSLLISCLQEAGLSSAINRSF